MRAVLISFFIFMASMFVVLPFFNIGTSYIPQEWITYTPFVLIGLAFLSQWNAFFDYKKQLDLQKLAKEASRESNLLRQELKTQKHLTEDSLSASKVAQERTRKLTDEVRQLRKDHEKSQKTSKQMEHLLSETETKLQNASAQLQKVQDTQKGSELLSFLSLLQEKGRFLDFLMDDVSQYTDAQIGAAGRVVHQGCSQVLSDVLNVSPLHEKEEGAVIEVQKDSDISTLKVLGKSVDREQFDAKILHRGWGTDAVNIPRRVSELPCREGKYVISPVEVESQS